MTWDPVAQVAAWGKPPIGGMNVDSADFLRWSDVAARTFSSAAWESHWAQPSNEGNALVIGLRFAQSRDKVVMDYGCGFGMDALMYLGLGAQTVVLADINEDNIRAAERMLHLSGYRDVSSIRLSAEPPFFDWKQPIDVFHANGVLHHTPHAQAIAEKAWSILKPQGEMRLMLYTEHAAEAAQKKGLDFVRLMDAVGDYADWYDLDKIARTFGDPFGARIVSHGLCRPDRFFRTVILKRT